MMQGDGRWARAGKKGKRPKLAEGLRRIRPSAARRSLTPVTGRVPTRPPCLGAPVSRPTSTRRSSVVAVKIRLMRVGKKKQPTYRVVVADGRSPARRPVHRDHRPVRARARSRRSSRSTPTRALHWLRKGAQPTEQVRSCSRSPACGTQYKADAARTRSRSSSAEARHRQGRAGEKAAKAAPAAEARRRAPAAEAAGRGRAGRGRAGRGRGRRDAAERVDRRSCRATTSSNDDDDFDDDDDDFDDEIGAEGNRVVGAPRPGRRSSTSPATSSTTPTASTSTSSERARRGRAARPREPRRHGPHHRQARSRHPGAAPGRARRRRRPRA